MDASENQRILELQSCLIEFFGMETSNDRKRQIEQMLDNFSRQPGAWKQFLLFLTAGTTAEPVLYMYCLSTIENTIKYRWSLLTAQEQNDMKSTLYAFLIRHGSTSSTYKCQPFVRNKIIKVLSDIGKVSLPEDFFNQMFYLISSDDTVIIGLRFLTTISEEWTNNIRDEEATTQRKLELKLHLTKEVPKIFNVLENILTAGMNHRGTVKANSTQNAQIDEVILLALESAIHYCSWVTLSMLQNSQDSNSKISPMELSFVQLLCQYSVFNFEISCQLSDPEVTQAVQAIGVLNELLYRKFVPKEFEKHMNLIAHFGVELLNKILNRSSSTPLPEQYMEKIFDFLTLIASSHFNQYNEQSAKAFLSLLLPFTFQQSETFYYDCLDIWGRLLDHLNAQLPMVCQLMNRDDYVETFKQPILALANGIVHCTAKYQVQPNPNEYFDLEDDEGTSPTLMRNIEILVKVGELLPTESLESLIATWSESCRFFGTLQTALDPSSKTVIRISNSIEIEHFHFIVQLIGRMANIFYSDVFKQEVALGKSLFQQLVGVYNFSKRFYFVKDPEVIVKMNCEIVYSLRLWTYWLLRFHSEVILGESTLEDQQIFFELLGILTEVVFYTLENHGEIELSIVLANVNFFLTLVSSIRTQFIFQISSVQALIQKIHLLKGSMHSEVYRILNKIVVTLVLLPWQSVSQQEWETRTQLYNSYMKTLMEDFVRNSTIPQDVLFNLNILNDQLELLMTENANSKKICWNVLIEIVPFLQKLSTTYLRQPKVSEEILSFFSKIMEVLRQQAGATFFESSIHGFLTLFSTENIINDLMRETESSSIVVEKFLQMLQFMVKDPSPSFKKFIGDALSICYDHVYPILSQRSTPDLKIPFFSLIRATLNYRWNYFFPTLVLHQQNISTIAPSPQQQQQDQIIAKRLDQILGSIGHSFLQSDLDVFRYNLNTLSVWNEKHNFYAKLPGKVIIEFMTVLLQVLVHKTHDLHREEIITVLHGMSSADSIQFQTFLHDFLQGNFTLIPVEQKDSLLMKFSTPESSSSRMRTTRDENRDHRLDQPSFSLLLTNFIQDLRYFHFQGIHSTHSHHHPSLSGKALD